MLKIFIEEETTITFVVDQDYFDGNKTYEEATKTTITIPANSYFSYDDTQPNANEIEQQL